MAGNDFIIYGGVKLDKSQVLRKYTVLDRDGKERYVVDFKNGTRVAYTKGANKDARIDSGVATDSVNLTGIYNVMGLELQGSQKQDVIGVNNSTVIGIDVSGDDNLDMVDVHNSKGTFGARTISARRDYNFGDGIIELDKHDEARIDLKSKMPPVRRHNSEN